MTFHIIRKALPTITFVPIFVPITRCCYHCQTNWKIKTEQIESLQPPTQLKMHAPAFCEYFRHSSSYLIRPDTLSPTKTSNTSSYFHVLMSCVHLSETFTNMWHHPPENFSTEDHARASHAKVLTWFQPQFSKFFSIAQACLAQVERLAAIQRS